MFERTLIITPHCDDETIGCGGLIHKLVKQGKSVLVLLVCSHSHIKIVEKGQATLDDSRYEELVAAMRVLDKDCESQIIIERFNYKDGHLDNEDSKELITNIDNIIYAYEPTAVLFPYASHHQDHQALNKVCIAALRPKVDTNFIKIKAMYEYPYLGSWGIDLLPAGKMYIPLSAEVLEIKHRALLKYESQLIKESRDILDTSSIIDFARVRGREIGSYAAEAYYPLTIIL